MKMLGALVLLLLAYFQGVSDPWATVVYLLIFCLPVPHVQEEVEEEVPANVEEEDPQNEDQDDEEQDPEIANEHPENGNEQPEINEPAEIIPNPEDIDEGFVDDDGLEDPVFFDAFSSFHKGVPLYEFAYLSNEATERLFNRLISDKTIMKMSGAEIHVFEEDVAKRRRLRTTRRDIEKLALKCSVCNKKYNTEWNDPRILQCGHTFCCSCIRVSLPFTPLTDDDMNTLTCYTCKASTFLHASMPPVLNQTILSVIHKLNAAHFNRFIPIDIKLKCPRCRLDYSNMARKKTPRVSLGCGHSTCELCIKECIGEFGVFACSECSLVIRPFYTLDEVFPENHDLQCLVQLL